MKQLTQNYRTGELKIEEVPLPLIQNGGVLVRNHYSLISSGTERSTISVSKKSYLGKAKEKPEQMRQVIHSLKRSGLKKTYELVMNKLSVPVPLGYSTSGTVIEVGEDASEFQVSDRVACAGGWYATHSEVVFIPKNLCVKIPPNVPFKNAAYTTIGAIALQGIRQADLRIGEHVAVIGLGLIGLLTVQILKASGCVVLGIDINNWATENAIKCGADNALNMECENIQSIVRTLTDKNGIDAVIITAATKSNEPVELAGDISRKKGRVVVVGDVGMKIPREKYYKKELDFKISCSYGPGRYDPAYEEYGIDYPIGYVRWTEKRNMEAFLQLLKEKRIDVERITTHLFDIDTAHKAYDIITGKSKQKFIGVLLKYSDTSEMKSIIVNKDKQSFDHRGINIGLIGAGNFAQSTLLPALRRYKNINLEGIVTAESYIAQHVAKKYGVKKCFSKPELVFSDENINTIIITTRHHLHANYVIEGLKNDKNVYVEKPLALNAEQLKEIISIYDSSDADVFVGFNRRFSPYITQVKKYYAKRIAPMFINYRINAGFISADHWVHSREEGGGRIIGEVCHFVDLSQFLSGSRFRSIFAQSIGNDELRDNVNIVIKFMDSSVANIMYLANGDISYPKERIEIFCQNSIAIIDDFKRLTLVRGGEQKIQKGTQDKGHQKQIELWLQSLEGNTPIPVPFIESVNSSIATFMIHESLNKEKVIYFNEFSKTFFG